jgi:chemotaxis protein CheD
MTLQFTTSVLMPGEYLFTEGAARVQTLLGSCVALVFWHPQRRIGGMSHIVLPNRPASAKPDARYADEFMQILIREMEARNTQPKQYQIRVYGAANMFSSLRVTCADSARVTEALCDGCNHVSCRNRAAVLSETSRLGLNVVEADLGGTGFRQVELNLIDGKTVVRTTRMLDTVAFDLGLSA